MGTSKSFSSRFCIVCVSIQLVSPASGDKVVETTVVLNEEVSIQLVSPASGDDAQNKGQTSSYLFPFN